MPNGVAKVVAMQGELMSEAEAGNVSHGWSSLELRQAAQQLTAQSREQWDRSQGSWADWMDAREDALAARQRQYRAWWRLGLSVMGVVLLIVSVWR